MGKMTDEEVSGALMRIRGVPRFAFDAQHLETHIAALVAEHRADVSRARAEALEEVAVVAERRSALARRVYLGHPLEHLGVGAGDALATLAADILADITTPAPASIPVERVREVLIREFGMRDLPHHNSPMGRVFTALGVPLDAATEKPLPPTACGQKDSRGWLCRQWDEHEGPHVFEPHPDAIAPERSRCACGHPMRLHMPGKGLCCAWGEPNSAGERGPCVCTAFRHVEQEGAKP